MTRPPVGTRVVMIDARAGLGAGTIVGIRHEPYLMPFIVELDSGQRVYASPAHVALENDDRCTPLGPSLHDD